MDFTAIDFETATGRRDSACQLAAVVVRGGKIVDTAMWMIRPQPCYFSPSNIQIHGITPQQVRDEPVFGERWPEISEKLGGVDGIGRECLVAHNASFDLGVLLACLQTHAQPIPELQFTCTRAIARRTWPGRRGYGLKPLANWLGIRFRHHDALEDSIACAQVLLAAGIDRQADSLSSLESNLRLTRGTAGPWGYKGATAARATKRRSAATTSRRQASRGSGIGGFSERTGFADHVAESAIRPFAHLASGDRGEVHSHLDGALPTAAPAAQLDPSRLDGLEPSLDLQRVIVRAEFIRPLSGHQIVFTGQFQKLSRELAEDLAQRSGGRCQRSVTRQTSLLVVGGPDERTKTAGRDVSVKQETAEKLRAGGQQITIVTEDGFLGLLQRNKA